MHLDLCAVWMVSAERGFDLKIIWGVVYLFSQNALAQKYKILWSLWYFECCCFGWFSPISQEGGCK